MKNFFLMPFIIATTATLNAQNLTMFKDDNGKWGYKNAVGEIIITAKYHYANDFKDGYAKVSSDPATHGFIDSTGKETWLSEYDGTGTFFSEGLLFVRKGKITDSRYGFVNTEGKLVIPLLYKRVVLKAVSARETFYNGLAGMQSTTGKYGYINTKGWIIIPFEFESAGAFGEKEKDLALVKKDGREFYIDTTGKEVK